MDNYQSYEIEDLLSNEFFVEWVLKPTHAHQLFWDKWLKEHPESEEDVRKASKIIKSLYIKQTDKQLSDEEVLSLSEDFRERISRLSDQQNKIPFWKRTTWLGAAAAILIFVIAGLIFSGVYTGRPDRRIGQPDMVSSVTTTDTVKVVNKDRKSKLIALPDGSLVVLRPNSGLAYPKTFTGNERTVFLKGEAFFDVRKNKSKPFLVYTGNLITKVLGTSFTVSAFSGNTPFKVTVNTGKVQVYNQKADKVLSSVTLMPDQQVILRPNSSILEKGLISMPMILSPKLAGKALTFTNAPLTDIVAKMEEAYGVSIDYDRSKFAGYTVTASLSKLPLEEKINAICKAIGASYEFTDNGIRIK